MEILGLLDHLESMICDSIKVPIINRTLVDEDAILTLIDKIKLVLQSDKEYISKQISPKAEAKQSEQVEMIRPETMSDDPDVRASQVLQQAYQVAKEIREGADKYADNVLSDIEATADRIIRTVRNGRARLGKGEQPAKPAAGPIRDLTIKEEDSDMLLSEHTRKNIIKAGRRK